MQRNIKPFIFVRNLPCCFTAEQRRSALRQGCYNSKEMKGLSKGLSFQSRQWYRLLGCKCVAAALLTPTEARYRSKVYAYNKKDRRISLLMSLMLILFSMFHYKVIDFFKNTNFVEQFATFGTLLFLQELFTMIPSHMFYQQMFPSKFH